MEITINVTADKLAEAILALAGSISGLSLPTVTSAPVNEIQEKKTEKAAPKEELPFEPDAKHETEVKKGTKAPELTLIDLREKFKSLQEKGLNIKEFLQANFGTSKLPDLDPEQYAEAIRLGEEAVS